MIITEGGRLCKLIDFMCIGLYMLGELGLKAKLTARLTCKLQTVMDTS